MLKIIDVKNVTMKELQLNSFKVGNQIYLEDFKPVPLGIASAYVLRTDDLVPNAVGYAASNIYNYKNINTNLAMADMDVIPRKVNMNNKMISNSPDLRVVAAPKQFDVVNIQENKVEKTITFHNDYRDYHSTFSYIEDSESEFTELYFLNYYDRLYIKRISKDDGRSIRDLQVISYCRGAKVLNQEDYHNVHPSGKNILLYLSRTNVTIVKIENHTVTVLKQFAHDGYEQSYYPTDFLTDGTTFYLPVVKSGELGVQKVEIDDALTVTNTYIPVRGSNVLSTYQNNDAKINHRLHVYEDKRSGETYFLQISTRKYKDNNSKTFIAIMKLNEAGPNLDIIDYINFDFQNDGKAISGVFYIDNDINELLVGVYDRLLYYYKIDWINKRINKINSFNMGVNAITQFSTGHVIIEDEYNKLWLFIPKRPFQVDYRLEPEYIEIIDNTAVDATVVVSAKNILNEYVAAKVKLVISSDNAIWIDNNSKEIIVTTSDAGEINVPIRIYDGGILLIEAFLYVGGDSSPGT